MALIPDPRRWVPYRVDLGPEDPVLSWCHLGDARPTEPFFDETLTRACSRPFNRWADVRTTMTATAAALAAAPPPAPTAFVFHVGRCGSTLLAQMLAADPANRVLSEPAPFDVVLRAPLSRPVTAATLTSWLRTTLGALAGPAPGERRLFVKLDSWAVLAAPLLADAFGDVPWLLLHRDPVEVVVSMLRHRPFTMIPTALPPELFGLTFDEAIAATPEEYAARVLGAVLDAFTTMRDRATVVAYPELPDATFDWLDRLGIERSPEVDAAMRAVTARHAKFPATAFADDRSAKQAAATLAVRDAVARWCTPTYDRLTAPDPPAGAGTDPAGIPTTGDHPTA